MNLKELLEKQNGELYDLKDEKSYSGDNLEKWLAYKFPQVKGGRGEKDVFDCDGSGAGEPDRTCKLIREVYRELWDWEDRYKDNDKYKILRYARSCIDDNFLMGPETMNSFFTSFIAYMKETDIGGYEGKYKYLSGNNIQNKKYGISEIIDDVEGNLYKEELYTFSKAVGRIGNMTLTYKGLNRYVCKDYWDLKLNRQILESTTMSESEKNRHINLFFQWDYVEVNDGKYSKKLFWDGHDKKCLPTQKNQFLEYVNKVDRYTQRRGLFMLMLLKIKNMDNDVFMEIREKILMSSDVFDGYEEVFVKIERQIDSEEVDEGMKEIIQKTKEKILAMNE